MTSPWERGPAKEIDAEAQYQFQLLEAADALEKISAGQPLIKARLITDHFIAMMCYAEGDDAQCCETMSLLLHGVLDVRNGRKPGALF